MKNGIRFNEVLRHGLVILILVFGIMNCRAVAVETDTPEITPEKAREFVGKKVVVKMTVKATKYSTKRKAVFLDSESDFQDKKNVGIVIESEALEKFRAAGIQEPHERFRDKLIKATGTIELRDDRIYLPLTDPKLIEIQRTEASTQLKFD